MGAFEEFQGMVSAGLATLVEGHELIHAARAKYVEARQQVADVAGTSVSPMVESSLANLDRVIAALDKAILWRGKGIDGFNEYLDLIGAQGSVGAKGSVGDQVTAPKLKRGDLEKEHAGADDGDSERGKSSKFFRAAVRNAGDLQKQGKTWDTAARGDRPQLDPPPSTVYTGTAQRTNASPVDPGDPNAMTSIDIYGTGFVIAAAVLEAAARIFNNRRKGSDGQGKP